MPGGYCLPHDRIFVVSAHALQDAAVAVAAAGGGDGGGDNPLLVLEEKALLVALAMAVVQDKRNE